jgi:hypothetical protein
MPLPLGGRELAGLVWITIRIHEQSLLPGHGRRVRDRRKDGIQDKRVGLLTSMSLMFLTLYPNPSSTFLVFHLGTVLSQHDDQQVCSHFHY